MKNISESKEVEKALEEDEYGIVCGRCWNSVCDPCNRDCDNHPIEYGQRWCHIHEKPVESLQDATHCKEYNDN